MQISKQEKQKFLLKKSLIKGTVGEDFLLYIEKANKLIDLDD